MPSLLGPAGISACRSRHGFVPAGDCGVRAVARSEHLQEADMAGSPHAVAAPGGVLAVGFRGPVLVIQQSVSVIRWMALLHWGGSEGGLAAVPPLAVSVGYFPVDQSRG